MATRRKKEEGGTATLEPEASPDIPSEDTETPKRTKRSKVDKEAESVDPSDQGQEPPSGKNTEEPLEQPGDNPPEVPLEPTEPSEEETPSQDEEEAAETTDDSETQESDESGEDEVAPEENEKVVSLDSTEVGKPFNCQEFNLKKVERKKAHTLKLTFDTEYSDKTEMVINDTRANDLFESLEDYLATKLTSKKVTPRDGTQTQLFELVSRPA